MHIQKNWAHLALSFAEAGLASHKPIIVTDCNVANIYLKDFPLQAPHIVLPAGEAEKNFASLGNLLTAFHQAGLDKSSLALALGGGVVSDITGFAASVYMRGISYVSLPTTLLSMVDSSLGGKTGIDFGGVKNLVGSFHHPKLIYANISTLQTLCRDQYISGLAEVIKYGIIANGDFFDYLCANRESIAAKNPDVLEKIIRTSCKIKTKIVQRDEKDIGIRQILNYGHTFGHAIESLCGFSLPHGHCVALGMVCAANFSQMFHVEHIKELLNFFGLPVKLPEGYDFNAEEIYSMMRRDKKSKDGQMTLIVSHRIGSAEIIEGVRKEGVMMAIETIL